MGGQKVSIWEEFALESRVREILKAARYDKRHHFGRPFLTAYQLAIAFDKAHREDRKRIGKPVGGKGTGQKDSLAQYLAWQLSRRIKSGELVDIEGRFLQGQDLRSLEYDQDDQGGEVVKSSSGKSDALSMFRLKDEGAR